MIHQSFAFEKKEAKSTEEILKVENKLPTPQQNVKQTLKQTEKQHEQQYTKHYIEN